MLITYFDNLYFIICHLGHLLWDRKDKIQISQNKINKIALCTVYISCFIGSALLLRMQ